MTNNTKGGTHRPDVSDNRPLPLFYIVSPNALRAHQLKTVLDSAFTVDCSCHTHLRLRSMVDQKLDHSLLYLLDGFKTDPNMLERYLDPGPASVPESMMVVLFNIDNDCDLAPLVRKFKVRGIFYQDVSRAEMVKGMKAVVNGHLWLTRKLLSECVRMAPGADTSPAAQLLGLLSNREKGILQRVGLGESNQEIAEAMNISPHTVKTHLYNIYRKININNRLQGAFWAATYLIKQNGE